MGALAVALANATASAAAPTCVKPELTRAVEVAAQRYGDCAFGKLENAYAAMAERHPEGPAILTPSLALSLCRDDGDILDAVTAGCLATPSYPDQGRELSSAIYKGIFERLRKAVEKAHPETRR